MMVIAMNRQYVGGAYIIRSKPSRDSVSRRIYVGLYGTLTELLNLAATVEFQRATSRKSIVLIIVTRSQLLILPVAPLFPRTHLF
jgi:hypothetical protein